MSVSEGRRTEYFTVHLLCLDVAPAFTQLPADTTVTDGTTAVLSCEVSGAPRPAIAWRRGRRSHLLQGAADAASEPSGPALCWLFSLIRSVKSKNPLTERPPGADARGTGKGQTSKTP